MEQCNFVMYVCWICEGRKKRENSAGQSIRSLCTATGQLVALQFRVQAFVPPRHRLESFSILEQVVGVISADCKIPFDLFSFSQIHRSKVMAPEYQTRKSEDKTTSSRLQLPAQLLPRPLQLDGFQEGSSSPTTRPHLTH